MAIRKPDPNASEASGAVTLDEYLKTAKVNPGLVASFKYEAKPREDEKRTSEEWESALKAQSARVY